MQLIALTTNRHDNLWALALSADHGQFVDLPNPGAGTNLNEPDDNKDKGLCLMRARILLSTLVASAIMAACAANPEKIEPKKVAVEPYLQMSCDQLNAERTKVQTNLADEEREQRSVRRNDAWGVALVFMPLGRMSGGNREDQIAELKGDAIAIDTASKSQKCTS